MSDIPKERPKSNPADDGPEKIHEKPSPGNLRSEFGESSLSLARSAFAAATSGTGALNAFTKAFSPDADGKTAFEKTASGLAKTARELATLSTIGIKLEGKEGEQAQQQWRPADQHQANERFFQLMGGLIQATYNPGSFDRPALPRGADPAAEAQALKFKQGLEARGFSVYTNLVPGTESHRQERPRETLLVPRNADGTDSNTGLRITWTQARGYIAGVDVVSVAGDAGANDINRFSKYPKNVFVNGPQMAMSLYRENGINQKVVTGWNNNEDAVHDQQQIMLDRLAGKAVDFPRIHDPQAEAATAQAAAQAAKEQAALEKAEQSIPEIARTKNLQALGLQPTIDRHGRENYTLPDGTLVVKEKLPKGSEKPPKGYAMLPTADSNGYKTMEGFGPKAEDRGKFSVKALPNNDGWLYKYENSPGYVTHVTKDGKSKQIADPDAKKTSAAADTKTPARTKPIEPSFDPTPLLSQRIKGLDTKQQVIADYLDGCKALESRCWKNLPSGAVQNSEFQKVAQSFRESETAINTATPQDFIAKAQARLQAFESAAQLLNKAAQTAQGRGSPAFAETVDDFNADLTKTKKYIESATSKPTETVAQPPTTPQQNAAKGIEPPTAKTAQPTAGNQAGAVQGKAADGAKTTKPDQNRSEQARNPGKLPDDVFTPDITSKDYLEAKDEKGNFKNATPIQDQFGRKRYQLKDSGKEVVKTSDNSGFIVNPGVDAEGYQKMQTFGPKAGDSTTLRFKQTDKGWSYEYDNPPHYYSHISKDGKTGHIVSPLDEYDCFSVQHFGHDNPKDNYSEHYNLADGTYFQEPAAPITVPTEKDYAEILEIHPSASTTPKFVQQVKKEIANYFAYSARKDLDDFKATGTKIILGQSMRALAKDAKTGEQSTLQTTLGVQNVDAPIGTSANPGSWANIEAAYNGSNKKIVITQNINQDVVNQTTGLRETKDVPSNRIATVLGEQIDRARGIQRTYDQAQTGFSYPGETAYDRGVIDWVNYHRGRHNLPPLQPDGPMAYAASIAASNQATMNGLSHYHYGAQPGWQTPVQRLASVGRASPYGYLENAYMGPYDAKYTVDMWMNSPGHRECILNPNATLIGVAYRTGQYGGYSTMSVGCVPAYYYSPQNQVAMR